MTERGALTDKQIELNIQTIVFNLYSMHNSLESKQTDTKKSHKPWILDCRLFKKKLKELIGDDDVMTSHYSNCVENTSLGTDTLWGKWQFL